LLAGSAATDDEHERALRVSLQAALSEMMHDS
jgi:hypothetical protein